MVKRFAAICLMLTLLLGVIIPPAWAQPQKNIQGDPVFETSAEAAILMDYYTGKVMYTKNADKKLPMASVTKLMTMLLACDAVAKGQVKVSDIVTTSEHAYSMGGSQIYLEPGEEMSFKEMMIAIATGSANDASVAVAEHIAGSEEAFVQMMNDKAKELKLKNTHFVNTTGLPAENHYTSAKDMSVVLREALKHPFFREISKIYEYDLRGGEFKLWNTNKLLKWYRGCDAGKTGWTSEAKYCLAASAERDNLRLIAVVLTCPEPKSHFRETMKLFNFGFARYQSVVLAQEGQKIKTLPVDKGTVEKVDTVTAKQVAVVVPRGGHKGIKGEIKLPSRIIAPVHKGQVIGTYSVTKDNEVLSKVDIVAGADIAKASPVQLMGKVFNSTDRKSVV